MSFETWQIYALGSALFAGLTAILAKMGVQGIQSNLATFVRTIVILLMTAAILTYEGQWQRPQEFGWRPLTFLVLSGIATGLSWLCYYRALQLGPASSVAPIDKLSLVFVVVMAWAILGEKLSWQVLVGTALMVVGSVVILFAGGAS